MHLVDVTNGLAAHGDDDVACEQPACGRGLARLDLHHLHAGFDSQLQAARGQLSLPWVIVCGATGAFLGDNASYAGGRWIGNPLVDRFFSGERARGRLDWAKRFLQERGSYVLVVARFVPGGRTATTFTSGLVHLRWATRFLPFIAAAAVLWSLYGGLLGYLGGRLFRDHPIYALLIAFGIAAAVGGSAELNRWLRKRG